VGDDLEESQHLIRVTTRVPHTGCRARGGDVGSTDSTVDSIARIKIFARRQNPAHQKKNTGRIPGEQGKRSGVIVNTAESGAWAVAAIHLWNSDSMLRREFDNVSDVADWMQDEAERLIRSADVGGK